MMRLFSQSSFHEICRGFVLKTLLATSALVEFSLPAAEPPGANPLTVTDSEDGGRACAVGFFVPAKVKSVEFTLEICSNGDGRLIRLKAPYLASGEDGKGECSIRISPPSDGEDLNITFGAAINKDKLTKDISLPKSRFPFYSKNIAFFPLSTSPDLPDTMPLFYVADKSIISDTTSSLTALYSKYPDKEILIVYVTFKR